ncbi:MAG: GTPase Era [Bacteroidota bacterium]|nr:GTPase Era [Bacteroidota bacterium]MDX5430489.1 GTPase Era [Bacteroidota bacterium]MDX5469250.1 GTPase Era [Bacteroidota bacterium]
MTNHRAGYISIIGKPNVGKSTLLNALMGHKMAIATPKAQTTRHRIFGIINGEDYQMVLSDTPGIIEPAYKLQSSMMHFVDESLVDGDVVLLIIEAGQKELGEEVEKRLKNIKQPLFLVINKIDQLSQEEVLALIEKWKAKGITDTIIPISALNKFNTQELKNMLIDLLPESPAYFDKEQYTDKNDRFFASEIIREKIFQRYKKEIPYSCEVVVNSFKEGDKLIKIQADILVERDSQKGILIGNKGVALKNTGSAARQELENFFGKQVYIELFVKVKNNWRNDEKLLREFGYDE